MGERLFAKNKISAGTIAFGIAPKINAMGRLSDATPVVNFLLTEDEEQLNKYVEQLNENNKKRQQMCEETFAEAEQKIKNELNIEKDKVIILADENWHPGIIGIVASKLVEKYYRPVLMVSISKEKQEARGSARSVGSLNLFNTLTEFADLFIQYGGHSLAAGFSFDLNKISFEKFREKLSGFINNTLSEEALIPELNIDLEIRPQDLTESFIRETERLEPFGESNPHPVFSMSNLILLETKTMGAKKNHLKLFLSDENGIVFEAVWWKKESLNIKEKEKVNIAFTPALNNYMDKTTIQLIVKDLKYSTFKEPEVKKIQESLEEEFEDISDTAKEEYETDIIIENLEEDSDAGMLPINRALNNNDRIKWIDYRNSTGLKRDFINYIKSLRGNILIFAETDRSLNILEKEPALKDFAVGRTDIKKADNLVMMDLPPDEKTFFNILRKTQAKEIFLIGLNTEIESVETVKKFSSMLKYAYNNKNGIINIEHIASLLYISGKSVLACVELLDCSGVIDVIEITEETIKFNFSGRVELKTIFEQPEYQNFIDTLKESERFRQKLSIIDIEKINKEINKICFEVV